MTINEWRQWLKDRTFEEALWKARHMAVFDNEMTETDGKGNIIQFDFFDEFDGYGMTVCKGDDGRGEIGYAWKLDGNNTEVDLGE